MFGMQIDENVTDSGIVTLLLLLLLKVSFTSGFAMLCMCVRPGEDMAYLVAVWYTFAIEME
jgi:hypothetical protein